MRSLAAAVLASTALKAVTFTLGCGPAEGTEGGPCHHASSCDTGEYCNAPLLCNGETCEESLVGYGDGAVAPPVPTCTPLASSSACESYEGANVCPTGAHVASSCRPTGDSTDAGALFCCAECFQGDPLCADPATMFFECNTPHVPSEIDAALACSPFDADTPPVLSLWCCGSSNDE